MPGISLSSREQEIKDAVLRKFWVRSACVFVNSLSRALRWALTPGNAHKVVFSLESSQVNSPLQPTVLLAGRRRITPLIPGECKWGRTFKATRGGCEEAEENPGAWLAKYLGFQKTPFSLISVGPFHSTITSFPLLSDFSLHPVSPGGYFCPASPFPSGVWKTEFCKGLLGNFLIISHPSAFRLPPAYLYPVRSEGAEFRTTVSNFQGNSLWRIAPYSG